MTHEQGDGQKEGQQEETDQDTVGEASGETRKAGKQAISSVMAVERDGPGSLQSAAGALTAPKRIVPIRTQEET